MTKITKQCNQGAPAGHEAEGLTELSTEQLAAAWGGGDPNTTLGPNARQEFLDPKYWQSDIVPVQRLDTAMNQRQEEWASTFESAGNADLGSATRHFSNFINDQGWHDETLGVLRDGPVAEAEQAVQHAVDQDSARAMEGAIVVQQIDNGHDNTPADANHSNLDASPEHVPDDPVSTPPPDVPSAEAHADEPNQSYENGYEPNQSYDEQSSSDQSSGTVEPNMTANDGAEVYSDADTGDYSEGDYSEGDYSEGDYSDYSEGDYSDNMSQDSSSSEPNMSVDPGYSAADSGFDY